VRRWKARLSLSDDSITGCGRDSNSPCYEGAVRQEGEREEEGDQCMYLVERRTIREMLNVEVENSTP